MQSRSPDHHPQQRTETNRTVVIHRRTKADHFLPELNISLQSSMPDQVENNPDDSVYCYCYWLTFLISKLSFISVKCLVMQKSFSFIQINHGK